jgi:hypothetical protein
MIVYRNCVYLYSPYCPTACATKGVSAIPAFRYGRHVRGDWYVGDSPYRKLGFTILYILYMGYRPHTVPVRREGQFSFLYMMEKKLTAILPLGDFLYRPYRLRQKAGVYVPKGLYRGQFGQSPTNRKKALLLIGEAE